MCREMKEFAFSIQRPRFLMPTDKVKLLRMPTEGDVKLPGACYHGLLADTNEQDEGAADGKPRRSLRLRDKVSQVRDT